jgi:phosphatidylinositol-3-phosphatase
MLVRSRRILAAAALAWVSIGCASGGNTVPAGATGVSVARARLCGGEQPRHVHYSHVVWIVMENTSFSDVIGSPKAPYINALARSCGLATSFFAEDHPSLPNYLAMTSGSTQGVSGDSGPTARGLAAPSLFGQLGSSWRVLAESMPSPCRRSDSGLYIAHHNPALYYSDSRASCAANDMPLESRFDLAARFTFITPNNCNNMHSCEVGKGDRWLAEWVPKIARTRVYRKHKTVLFVTWDEGDESQRIATLVISPSTRRGARSGASYNHYALLRTTEELLGQGLLGKAVTAESMQRPSVSGRPAQNCGSAVARRHEGAVEAGPRLPRALRSRRS